MFHQPAVQSSDHWKKEDTTHWVVSGAPQASDDDMVMTMMMLDVKRKDDQALETEETRLNGPWTKTSWDCVRREEIWRVFVCWGDWVSGGIDNIRFSWPQTCSHYSEGSMWAGMGYWHFLDCLLPILSLNTCTCSYKIIYLIHNIRSATTTLWQFPHGQLFFHLKPWS